MNQFKPHAKAAFEGYYSKFRLPSGASLALIVCSVFGAEQRPHMVSLTYVPSQSRPRGRTLQGRTGTGPEVRTGQAGRGVIQKEVWVDSITYDSTGPRQFKITVAGIGEVTVKGDIVSYSLSHSDFSFTAQTGGDRVGWIEGDGNSTPAGLFTHLPLPIQWHVHTLASSAIFTLSIPGNDTVAPEDRSGSAIVHIEKNWARSFPKSYIWVQGLKEENKKGICIAGGNAIEPVEAYLIGYRPGNGTTIGFRPPFTVSVLGVSPFVITKRNVEEGYLMLSVQSFTRKIVVTVKTDPETFFTLSAPLPEGHRPKFCAQSFEAEIKVETYSSWLGMGPWRKRGEDTFSDGSLEFGGEYYTKSGKSKSI